jgi:hypothetical protein
MSDGEHANIDTQSELRGLSQAVFQRDLTRCID